MLRPQPWRFHIRTVDVVPGRGSDPSAGKCRLPAVVPEAGPGPAVISKMPGAADRAAAGRRHRAARRARSMVAAVSASRAREACCDPAEPASKVLVTSPVAPAVNTRG
ncbi:hypothetical protein ACFFX0_12800 [Citricoccus parietis]|uniref:Uncharacterized protein n=1 Tax=Citricoccus parietis TaxID=592307 RepID=A0ABV5FZD8_9MICC